MIRVVMLGRLGNNLFQYAFARTLAVRYDTTILMDASWFDNATWSQVSCINRLPLKATTTRSFSLASRALRKITNKHKWEYYIIPQIREKPDDHTYTPIHNDASENCMLFGYFQSPYYFKDIDLLLRDEICLNSVFDNYIKTDLFFKLSNPGSVSVHVRRQDFKKIPEFDVCNIFYYTSAIDSIRSRITNPHFYIFSDDPDWCKNNFHGSDQTVIDHVEHLSDPLFDMYLMSLTNHHIIANSTYSWWAAWIGKKENQIVICPSRWFNFGIIAPINEKLCDGWEIMDSMRLNI
jgi:Glycosyl transferase family 11